MVVRHLRNKTVIALLKAVIQAQTCIITVKEFKNKKQ
jgi:hypothetical protein